MCICDDGTFVAGARMLAVLGAGKVLGNGKGQRLRRAARISADRAHALIPKLTSGRATQRLLHALSLWRRCLLHLSEGRAPFDRCARCRSAKSCRGV